MIYIPPVPDLEIIGVINRGMPNVERIVLKTRSRSNLGQYMLLLAFQTPSGSQPITDQCFWFSDLEVETNTWIYVYTGQGQTRLTTTSITQETALVMHWNKSQAILSDKSITPVLIQIGGIDIPKPEVFMLGTDV